MRSLNDYFARFFFNRSQLAAASGVSSEKLDELLGGALIPAPSYVVASSAVRSAVFGEMSAPGAEDGEYFHQDMIIWVKRATESLARLPREQAYEELRNRFRASFRLALAELNGSVWRLRDSFNDDGSLIEEGYSARFESVSKYFANGTYGLCVTHPVSEYAIARKEVLQEKLVALTTNGSRTCFSADERHIVELTMNEYAEACAPFSPLDYPRSSRKRLVDDLRTALQCARQSDDTPADFPLDQGCGAL